MTPLSQYRLNRYSEIQDLLTKAGNESFHEYRDSIYRTLNGLQPDQSFNLRNNVKPENLELFIKITCLYILEAKEKCNIVFSDDYEIIRGVKIDNTKNKKYHERIFRGKQTKT